MKKAAVVLLVLVACGKRGDPRPPVPMIPQATSDLVVTQRANTVVLSWSFPALTAAGAGLRGPRRIVVYRHQQELPPSVVTEPEMPPEPEVPHAVQAFSTVPELTLTQFARLSQRIQSIEDADLGDHSAGARLQFTDTPPFRQPPGRPIRLTYAVVTESPSGRSELSNLVTIVPLPVAQAPSSLTATARSGR